MEFTKYHGLGNDFIILKNAFQEGVDYSNLAKKLCHRQSSIGADGLIIAKFNPRLEMVFFNADGSRGEMCGNGIRCFVKFLLDEKKVTEHRFTIDTLAGPQLININSTSPFSVTVNLGKAKFNSEDIPIRLPQETQGKAINIPLVVNNQTFYLSSLFMGVPHTVIRVQNLHETDINNIGKQIESHPWFPEKTNVNFVEVLSKNEIKMQTYERGVGITLACGTGACSAVVMGNYLGYLDPSVTIQLPLGSLEITLAPDNSVYMKGSAIKICEGVCYA